MTRWLPITLAATVAYALAGHFSLLLAVPPANIVPIWPPAGIALVFVLLYGPRSLPGIFIGSYVVHLGAFLDNSSQQALYQSLLVGVGTSAGSMLQALLGYWLVKRTVRQPLTLLRQRDVLHFMLAGGLAACTVAPSLGVITLTLANALDIDNLAVTWGTWWVGDSTGVIIVAPILLALFGQPADRWRPRRTTLALPLLVALSLAISFYHYATVQVHARVDSQFQRDTGVATQALQSALSEIVDRLQATGALLLASERVSQIEFDLFTASFDRLGSVRAVYWIDRTRNPTHPALTSNFRLSGCEASPPPLDELSSGALFRNTPSIVSQTGDCTTLYTYHPVVKEQGGLPLTIGAAVVAIDVAQLMARTLETRLPADSSLSVDLVSPDDRVTHLLRAPDGGVEYVIESGFAPAVETPIAFGDARLVVRVQASSAYVARQYGWEAWAVLTGGLAFSALLGIGLLILTGRHARTEELVQQRTVALGAEIEERRLAERLLESQNAILERIARDEPLLRTLTFLCHQFESICDHRVRTFVTLYDAKRGVLQLAAGPSLSTSVRESLRELSAAVADAPRDPAGDTGIRVEEIDQAQPWAAHRDCLLEHRLYTCWSVPFFSKSDGLLGTFCLLHDRLRSPQSQEQRHMRSAAFLCSLAAEQSHAKEHIAQLSLALEQSPAAVAMTDFEGRIEYANPRFAGLTCFDREQSYGRVLADLLRSEAENADMEQIWGQALSGREWRGTVRNVRSDGSTYWAQFHVSPMRDEGGNITHVLVIQDDVTALRESNAKIVYQATHDLLTGLINRAEFEVRLQHCLESARRYRQQHVLCFIDLDQFKIVNDSNGHAAGDELLRQLGRLMQNHIRKSDILARIGGDEFAILFEHCSVDEAQANVDKLRQRVAEYPFNWNQRCYNVGLSAGLVAIDAASPNADELMREADAACYTAKETGRDRVQVYSSDDETTARRSNDIRWVTTLRTALAEDRFELYQQRIEYLHGRRPCQAIEILLRLRQEDGEPVSPGLFLPAAERFGVAPAIDSWVTHRTLQLLEQHPYLLQELDYCSINLSGLSLNTEFAQQILDWLEQYSVPATRVCFEITETAAIANLTQATGFMEVLRLRGVRFALDDFGSGLSSFAYLKNLPVDILKIDGQFVRDILSDPIDLAMVKAINEIGKVMGKQTVAEFVERPEMLEHLRALQVDAVQGYAIGRPVPFDELLHTPPAQGMGKLSAAGGR